MILDRRNDSELLDFFESLRDEAIFSLAEAQDRECEDCLFAYRCIFTQIEYIMEALFDIQQSSDDFLDGLISQAHSILDSQKQS